MRVFLAAALALPLVSSAAESQQRTLYQRLGGYDAIAAVVDDFIPRLATDSSLGRFFAGHATGSTMRIRQLVVDQICAVAGGPCVYTGRDAKSAHDGLGITERDWNHAVHLLTESLDRFRVPAPEKNELLAVVSGLKKDIVER
jgi:hemoglobin